MIKVVLGTALVLFLMSAPPFAMMSCSGGKHSAHAKEGCDAEKADAIVNKPCRMTGEPVDKNITYEHKGKLYGFCCPACIEEFKKDPEKYIGKIEAESKGAAAKAMGHEGHQH